MEKTSGSLPRKFVSLFLHDEYKPLLYDDDAAKIGGAQCLYQLLHFFTEEFMVSAA